MEKRLSRIECLYRGDIVDNMVKKVTVNSKGIIYLKNVIGNDIDCLYMLIKTDCIEFRTEEQHKKLVDSILSKSARDNRYSDLYAKIYYYSKRVSVDARGMLYLGENLVFSRGFDKAAFVEVCDNCFKLWTPKMFEKKLEKENTKKGRVR